MSYELWTTHKLDLNTLKPWSYIAYAHYSSYKYGKLCLRGKKYVFIRYSEHSKELVFIGEQKSKNITEFES
jgi:hypothetical protein